MRYPWSIPALTACLCLAACTGGEPDPGAVGAEVGAAGDRAAGGTTDDTGPYSGSVACRPCHERFYELWAPSHHGLAMQPYTTGLGLESLVPYLEGMELGEATYTVELDGDGGRFVETVAGNRQAYEIDFALGGKNVYYFLTRMDRGWLQVLPLAFDVRTREWFDTAASAIRHFPNVDEEALAWRDREYTFNTSCYGCHVSQLETNYDATSDSYSSTWVEPGINCETCHGPAAEHIRVTREAPEGEVPDDLAIIMTTRFDEASTNDLCAPCHAKMSPMSESFLPGDRFFDHFDLITLEHPDFYPDGRDLGENYTMTGWAMSPCALSGQLDCVHCHTSSGRFRQADAADESCLPCHAERVADPEPHTRHAAGTAGGHCIDCHMPATEFARMVRHDHSMLPPTPAATVAFDSPNACNICHVEHDARWADRLVREWRDRDFQAPVLRRAGLIAAARDGDWSRLDEMLDYVGDPSRDAVFASSLIRLARPADTSAKWQALRAALADPSPLVRGAAAEALGDRLDDTTISALATATRDEYRIVRVRAAAALAPVPAASLPRDERSAVAAAEREYEAALGSRPDDFALHANLGNHYLRRGEPRRAVESFERSLQLRPDYVGALVNAAFAYDALGRTRDAEASLRRALEVNPDSIAANLNLGLLLAGDGRRREAEEALRAAIDADPELAQAAFNLGVLVADEDPVEGLRWCRRAYETEPTEPRYGYTYAFYLYRDGRADDAIGVLRRVLLAERGRGHVDSILLLGTIYEDAGRLDRARDLYRRAVDEPTVPEEARSRIAQRLSAISGST